MLDLTFVIPALNEEALIAKCIRSIRSECTAPIIVIDNGSTDNTVAIASAIPGVTVISERQKGITRARQRGLINATTKWVAFIDADSELPDLWVIEANRALWYADRDGIIALSGPVMFRDLLLFSRIFIFAFYVVGKILHNIAPMVQGGNCIINREALLSVGGFDTNVEFYGEDTVTARRLSHAGKLKFNLSMYCYASARRFLAEGLIRIGIRYALNYLWVWIAGRPLTRTHRDHREST
jgi:glycosyltransferase involved in cell wall biosynthesis